MKPFMKNAHQHTLELDEWGGRTMFCVCIIILRVNANGYSTFYNPVSICYVTTVDLAFKVCLEKLFC